MKELEDMRNDELLMVIIAGIQILRENERKQGYEDGKKEKLANAMIHDHEVAEKKAYEQGLNESWECARKMCLMSPEERLRAFDVSGNHLAILSDLTASKAIVKLKAFEQKQKCKECKKTKDPIFYGHCVGECDYAKQTEYEIKVGYEVYNIDRDNKRIVTAIDGNKAIQLCSNGKYTVDNIDTLHWTGREDLRIKKVLEKITGETDGYTSDNRSDSI